MSAMSVMTGVSVNELLLRRRAAASKAGALWSLDVLMAFLILILLNVLALGGIGDASFK